MPHIPSSYRLPRVFIGTNEIASTYRDLAKGLESLGYDVTMRFNNADKHGYPSEFALPSIDFQAQELRLRLGEVFPGALGQQVLRLSIGIIRRIANAILRGPFGVVQLFRHDVFIFGFGSSLLPLNFDLYILRLWRSKRVVSNLSHGSESLPPFADGAWRDSEQHVISTRELKSLTTQVARRARRHERLADVVVGSPLTSDFFINRKLVDIYRLGRPLDGERLVSQSGVATRLKGETIRIAHAPSHRAAKGTETIVQLVERLQGSGLPIDFVLIEKRTNDEVLELLATVDLVIDQLYSDRYWSRLVAEAAVLGVPSIVAGYGFEKLDCHVPPHLRPPGIYCHPELVEGTLVRALASRSWRDDVGLAAREFAFDFYSLDSVAKRWSKILGDSQPPSDFLYEPGQMDYVFGCGQSSAISADNYRRLVSSFGEASLRLGDKPSLRNLLRAIYSRELSD